MAAVDKYITNPLDDGPDVSEAFAYVETESVTVHAYDNAGYGIQFVIRPNLVDINTNGGAHVVFTANEWRKLSSLVNRSMVSKGHKL